jgi:glycosyltransferase involved in cell wall biosynthesis
MAVEIHRQAKIIAGVLGQYLIENEIELLLPVNVASNPGNPALTLALVLVTEALGTVVVNINHDFYWEDDKPSSKRKAGEALGNRDHFFRNYDNRPFFSIIQLMYPWKGRRWLQININKMQSKRLIRLNRVPKARVFEITTSVSNRLMEKYTFEDICSARRRMATILSDGEPEVRSRSLGEFRENLSIWMGDQRPVLIGARGGLVVDVCDEEILYLLQPTRVIGRKRIERGIELIQALLLGPMREIFGDSDRQLMLHITGPTPLEHQADLETVLDAFARLINQLSSHSANRVFIAFSGGQQTHPSFEKHSYKELHIAEIYRMASVILFPSEIEGRGLPIIESAATGIPIMCSRYQPQEVFADVIGEDLPKELRIRHLLIPEGTFTKGFLNRAAGLLTNQQAYKKWRGHNRQAVRRRYSEAALRKQFQEILEHAYELLH